MFLATAVVEEGNYEEIDARSVADVLFSLTDGMWLSCLVNPETFDRRRSLTTIQHYLRAVFPNHYT